MRSQSRGQSTIEYMLLLVTVCLLASLLIAVLRPILSKGGDQLAQRIEYQLGKGVYQFRVK